MIIGDCNLEIVAPDRPDDEWRVVLRSPLETGIICGRGSTRHDALYTAHLALHDASEECMWLMNGELRGYEVRKKEPK